VLSNIVDPVRHRGEQGEIRIADRFHGSDDMRFFVGVKADAGSESGAMPSAGLIRAMTEFNEELVAAGVMIDGDGLQPSSEGFKILTANGESTIVDGPFAETKEMIAGYWVIQAKSLAEAIAWAKRAPMDFDGDPAQLEIRPIFEVDDFPVNEDESGWRENEEKLREEWQASSPGSGQGGLAPTPGKLVYMGLVHATADSEAGVLPTEAELAKMGALVDEAAEAGILLGGEGLRPSSDGVKINFANGERTVVDGPFAETKELIGGYALMQFDTEEQAREWNLRFAQASGQEYLEIRKVYRTEDFTEGLRDEVPDVFEAEERMRAQLAEQRR